MWQLFSTFDIYSAFFNDLTCYCAEIEDLLGKFRYLPGNFIELSRIKWKLIKFLEDSLMFTFYCYFVVAIKQGIAAQPI